MTWSFDAGIASSWVVLLLVLLAIEALVLGWWSRRRLLPRGLGWHLGAGACLALALRGALDRSSLIELGFFLAASGACHAIALWRSMTAITTEAGARPGSGPRGRE